MHQSGHNDAPGDTIDLSYTRVSGNMNLGLVMLSAANEVFFQASLVTSTALTTQFTLPVAGQYTIGVFRISLVAPVEFMTKVTGLTTMDVEALCSGSGKSIARI